MTERILERIVATTDVHSQLGEVGPLLAGLHRTRRDALVVDCGDFFEGTGYYSLGQGRIETEILVSLFDVLAPGNHGWRHHLQPGLREMTVCANVIEESSDEALFRHLHRTIIGGRRVAVTAVIGEQAFAAIPVRERAGHYVIDPASALTDVWKKHRREVDAWVLLSHSGFDHDLRLAEACPFLDVIFAGHCHSERHGPERVGSTVVVKGAELASGFSTAAPAGRGWDACTARFEPTDTVPAALESFGRQIELLRDQLTTRIGPLDHRWRGRTLDRMAVLEQVASWLPRSAPSAVVILNESALRQVHLGQALTADNLLAIEPFGNRIVHARVEPEVGLSALLSEFAERAGPLVVEPDRALGQVSTVLTTDYLAETLPLEGPPTTVLELSQAVRHVLCSEVTP
ncbi:metallophosphoesterase [Promicromonospora sp. CA-289599]|uniref:metallophosphoesterase n=1 Tax=Promicromonospora sp. CA-289599 TaxID=3240014 RepID=UPI003D8B6454